MINITQQGDTIDYGIIESIADTRADVTSLPTSWKPGSTCLVLADSSVWTLNSDKIWTELSGGSSGSGKVDDVKVNGTSVVTDKVANITGYTVTIEVGD